MNDTILISIIHPSRQRPELAFKTQKKWMSSAIHKENIEYRLSLDNDDPMTSEYNSIFRGDESVIIDYNNNKSAIEAINNCAQSCRGNLFVVVSDDFDCFEGWDDYLLKSLEGKEDYLVRTSDGYNNSNRNWLVTLPIMDRAYYNRFGYIYHPDYIHLWCDTEMTAVGEMLGKIVDLQGDDCIFKHLHHSINLTPKDSISSKNDSTWNQGKDCFRARFEKDFDLKAEEIQSRLPREMFYI